MAGNGTGGFSGDNGPATSAELATPAGVALDASGILYIADIYNNRIRKVSPSGIITTVAGNGTQVTLAIMGLRPVLSWIGRGVWPWTPPATSTSRIHYNNRIRQVEP